MSQRAYTTPLTPEQLYDLTTTALGTEGQTIVIDDLSGVTQAGPAGPAGPDALEESETP